jgi:hypothetical protein
MLALMDNEVPGPRIPGPMPGTDLYDSATDKKTAICRVKNYTLEQLQQLVPSCQVIQEGNARTTTIVEEGFTQESYHDDNNNSSDPDDDDNDATEEDNIFASSLLLYDSSTIAIASAGDILKPQINEVMQCLDTLKSKPSIKIASKVLNDLANELRLQLANSSGPKRNIETCLTVAMRSVNLVENATSIQRDTVAKKRSNSLRFNFCSSSKFWLKNLMTRELGSTVAKSLHQAGSSPRQAFWLIGWLRTRPLTPSQMLARVEVSFLCWSDRTFFEDRVGNAANRCRQYTVVS